MKNIGGTGRNRKMDKKKKEKLVMTMMMMMMIMKISSPFSCGNSAQIRCRKQPWG